MSKKTAYVNSDSSDPARSLRHAQADSPKLTPGLATAPAGAWLWSRAAGGYVRVLEPARFELHPIYPLPFMPVARFATDPPGRPDRAGFAPAR